MRKSGWITMLMLTAGLLLLPGCLDLYFTTEVNPDGSLDKTVVFKGDSSEIIGNSVFSLLNSDWDTTWIPVDDKKMKFVATRHFKNPKLLNKWSDPQDSAKIQIRSHVVLKKQFRWFYTYFKYQETLPASNPFQLIDWKDYLTPVEIRLIAEDDEARKKDSAYVKEAYDQTEKRFETFLEKSIYEEFFTILLAAPGLPSTGITAGELQQKKSEIFQYLKDNSDGDRAKDLLKTLSEFMKHPELAALADDSASSFKIFNHKMDFFQDVSDDNYHFIIRLPGQMLDTNSTQMEGSDIKWDVGYYDFFFKDLVMQAESRVVNTWAFIVAGIILLLAVISLITSFIIKKARK